MARIIPISPRRANIYMINVVNPARSTVRHRSGKDYRKHSPRHQPPAVRVRRHWRTALQGRIIGPRLQRCPEKRSKKLLSSEPLVVYILEWYNILPVDTQ